MDREKKPVVWSLRATKDLEKITRFYIDLYGHDKARKIVLDLRECTEILEREDIDTSEIGTIDVAIIHLKQNYRKLLHHHFKITYREGKTKFYIVRVFDTRQHPNKNK